MDVCPCHVLFYLYFVMKLTKGEIVKIFCIVIVNSIPCVKVHVCNGPRVWTTCLYCLLYIQLSNVSLVREELQKENHVSPEDKGSQQQGTRDMEAQSERYKKSQVKSQHMLENEP